LKIDCVNGREGEKKVRRKGEENGKETESGRKSLGQENDSPSILMHYHNL